MHIIVDGPMENQTDKRLRQRISVWLATGLGVGFIPWAPGTAGALWGLGLAWGLTSISVPGQVAVICVLAGAGVPLCTSAARELGGKKDPGAIVFDEIVSVPMTFFLVPMENPLVIVLGFALNRVFDITKPPPARQCERLPQGLGIMADDWAAGVYSCAVLHLLVWRFSL